MVTVRDKLSQIAVKILEHEGYSESITEIYPSYSRGLIIAEDIWKIIFGEYPEAEELDREYNVVDLLFDVAKAGRPLSLSTMDKVWKVSEDDVEVEADWGVEEDSIALKTISVTLVYGQPQQPEYRGYDLVNWLD